MSSNTLDKLFTLTVLLIIVVVYVTPSFIAFRRNHPNRWLIAVVNIVFGGTLLGWLVALVWALKVVHLDKGKIRGGESGLNIFAGDVRKVEIVPSSTAQFDQLQGEHGSPSLAAEIEKLHRLLQQGVITENEFSGMKARLLSENAA